MGISAVIAGNLLAPPEQRQSKAGKAFVTGTIKFVAGDQTRYARFTAFSATAIEALAEADAGTPVAISGPLTAEIYAPEGQPARLNLNIIADAAIAQIAEIKPKRPRPAPTAAQQYRRGGHSMSGAPAAKAAPPAVEPELNDDVGF